jgi:hypothetical protein
LGYDVEVEIDGEGNITITALNSSAVKVVVTEAGWNDVVDEST